MFVLPQLESAFLFQLPVEQVAQLNSLEYSINNAAKKLSDAGAVLTFPVLE